MHMQQNCYTPLSLGAAADFRKSDLQMEVKQNIFSVVDCFSNAV